MPFSEAPAPPAKVPAKSVEQDIVGDRGRLVSIGMGAVFVACVVFAALRLAVSWHTGRLTPWWGNALGAGAITALYLWFRVDPIRRSSVGVHGTALIATVALTIPAAYGMSSSKWWLALVGFSVILMSRRSEARVWAAVTAFMLPATAFVEPYIQIANAVGESGVERAMSGLFFVVLLMGVTAGFRDVADRRAQELSETAASLARANAVKSRFLAHMSHEVRTPLHGVIAMTDMAMDGDASPVVRQQIQTAQQSARILLGLLNNVLDVARAEADALEIEERPFSIHAALGEVLRPLAAQARARGLTFEARADEGILEARVGDRVRFAQILLNLVGNALKFTREGGIAVALRAVAGHPERLVIAVTDSGGGIATGRLGAIFEPFVQASVADARVEGGVGLGLAIVRELAHRMGGEISVTSVVGKGSTFTVEIQCALDPAQPAVPGPVDLLVEPPAPRASQVDRSEVSLSILVCEDNTVNQLVLRAMLGRLGHRAEIVDDGVRAWERLQSERFDLLLTDIEMPGMGGVELTRRIRERERAGGSPRMPVIGATAHVGEDEHHRLLEAGMDAHLAKPFTLADLATLLARVARGAPAAPHLAGGGAGG